MKIGLKLNFESFEELKDWFDNSCTLCAMNNSRCNCCANCPANKIWKLGLKDFNKEDEDKDEN